MTTATPPPKADTAPTQELLQKARQAMLDMFKLAPSPSPDQTVEAVAERVLDSQNVAFDVMRSFASVWTELAEKGISTPAQWKEILERTSEQLRPTSEGMLDPKQVLDQWRSQGEQWMATFAPWRDAAGANSPFQVPAFPGGEEMTAFLSSPSIGLAREYQNEVNHLFEEWLEYQKADFEYKQLLGQAWSDAFKSMIDRMGAMLQKGEHFESPRQLIDVWIEVADEVFTDLFQTEDFSLKQSELLNYSHAVRKGRKALTEKVLRASDLPTRSDVDEAHRVIYQLRKEVRALRKEVDGLRAERSRGGKDGE